MSATVLVNLLSRRCLFGRASCQLAFLWIIYSVGPEEARAIGPIGERICVSPSLTVGYVLTYGRRSFRNGLNAPRLARDLACWMLALFGAVMSTQVVVHRWIASFMVLSQACSVVGSAHGYFGRLLFLNFPLDLA